MSSTLVVSISGIRGIVGNGFDPEVVVRFVSAYAAHCRRESGDGEVPVVVVGRDARVSGALYADLTMATLQAAGCQVIDAGLATTPTVEIAVIAEGAAGGIVLSASHNPQQWNALKLLNGHGEFLAPDEAHRVIREAEALKSGATSSEATKSGATNSESLNSGDTASWADFDALGGRTRTDYLDTHIALIMDLPEIDPAAIGRRGLRVLIDGVDSVGGVAMPRLLERLGVSEEDIIRVNCEPTGRFSHPAEPLPENLTDTCERVRESGADIGLVVDPDADRLALIAEGGVYVSEEMTQVLAADFWWRHHSGPFVTNLSSSRAIEDVAARHGQTVHRSAVGEINVVEKMKEVGAVIGGEGNGGVILPALHHGRDALCGAALILQFMADTGSSLSALVEGIGGYHMVKQKTPIGDRDPDRLLQAMARTYASERVSTVDGVKIDFDEGWVHMRKSNTEPIIRVYSEARSKEEARALGERFMRELLEAE